MKKDETFKIEIQYVKSGETDIIEITTKDIEFSMNQYARNRDAFTWKIIDTYED